MDIFAQYETDPALELAGVWQKLGDSEFLIARLGNPAYVASISKKFEENSQALDVKGDAAEKLSNQLMVETWAETILLDWKNVSFRGLDTPYTREAAKTALALKDFRVKILELADKLANYKAKQEEVKAGN